MIFVILDNCYKAFNVSVICQPQDFKVIPNLSLILTGIDWIYGWLIVLQLSTIFNQVNCISGVIARLKASNYLRYPFNTVYGLGILHVIRRARFLFYSK
ncbi:hypothetical protein [Nostoc sp. UCD120]|uniref:hypothetical protein n=1 Tax=Nostoc sp. UCD120 TaxID=2681312 RepID=UPI001627F030|nr:hypothetical protein [Nostoc sp. UCD120]MBC1220837.1 hypothetical protein [Nostoc sp. UCD120]